MENGRRDSGASSSPRLSPLWGEPGRQIPRITSHLSLGPSALDSVSLAKAADADIEDFGKSESTRHETKLLEELVLSSPRLSIRHTDTATPLCPRCHKSTCAVSNPPPGYYSPHQVAAHTRPGDCWITAHGNVYDCSRYLAKHPGGARTILRRAGDDATRDFEYHTRHGKQHWGRLQVGRLAMCSEEEIGGDCTIA